ncbi:uncharacterized protein LOC130825428 [Amaranthus tricolor]|uniref:uncharacterized protein LOC130825428 n=1 Tax=Amaranthus tricolor TaxID=29722 RepID=UPI002582EB42|nr:uncharacterized protein LOC130825428 [Amaranthus tricolor]
MMIRRCLLSQLKTTRNKVPIVRSIPWRLLIEIRISIIGMQYAHYLPWIELRVKKLSNIKNLWQLWRKKMKLAVHLRQTLHHLTRGQRKILSWMLFLDLQSRLKTIYNQTNFHLSPIPKRFMMLFQRLPD